MTRSSPSIGVVGIGTYLPPVVRNLQDIAQAVRMPEQWVTERTGIQQRYEALPEQATSDLAAEAVRAALDSAGLSAAQLDLLVVGTTTPDEIGQATACRVQHLVGATRAVAMDVSAACSSWLFGARIAHDWLAARGGCAAVVGCEVYSRFLDHNDRATAVLFGDGAAATVLGPVPHPQGFGPITLASDGARAGHAHIPAGGSRRPASAQTVRANDHSVRMDGRAARDFVYDIFPRMTSEALLAARVKPDQIDAVVAHQPNPVLLRKAYANTGLPEDRLIVIGQEVGNLGAASLPYSLAQAAAQGRLRTGSKILVVAFGAGLTWGNTVLTWSGATAARSRQEAS